MGAFLLVRGEHDAASRLRYRPPGGTLARTSASGWRYHLLVQKQPGTRGDALEVQVQLPPGSLVTGASEGAIIRESEAVYRLALTEDRELWVEYRTPGPAPSSPPMP